MNSVRHVSMVDRDVALTVRVTDRPKKLKPLRRLSVTSGLLLAEQAKARAYPMLIMMRMLETSILGSAVICLQPSTMSK